MTNKSSGFFYGRKESTVDDSTIHHVAESAMTLLQKTFIAISSMNIGLSLLAFLNFVPVVAPAVSMIFVVWVGWLTVKGKIKDNKLKDLKLEQQQQQRQVDEANG